MDKAKLPGSIPLATRLGNEIPNEQIPDAPPGVLERLRRDLHRKYPDLIECRPPTGQYNCHGMTLASRRTGIHDPKVVRAILNDDGYKATNPAAVEPGDLAIYHDMDEITHTGVVLKVVRGEPDVPAFRTARVLSKWGYAGVYVHMAREGEYSTANVTYWTVNP